MPEIPGVHLPRRSRLKKKNRRKIYRSATNPSCLKEDQEISSSCSTNFPNRISEIRRTENNLVGRNLAKFIISINVPYDVVEMPSFIDLVKSLVECGPDYKPPSPSTLRKKYIPDIMSDVERYITSVKESWTSTGCTIMLNRWNSLVNVFAYSPKGLVYLKSQQIGEFEIEEIVSSAIEDIGVENVVQIITKSGRIYKSTQHLLENKYPHIYLSRCIANEIQSLLKTIYEEVKWVKETLDDGELIVKYIHEQGFLLSLLREYSSRKLKLPCTSKVASKHRMLQSIFYNKSDLQNLVKSSSFPDCKTAKKIASNIQSIEFWSGVQDVLNTLEPIVQVLCLVENDGPTSGYLYQGMERAREAIKKYYSIDKKRYTKILELFEERRSQKIIQPIHTAAAFLNPALKSQLNREMKAGIEYVFETLVRNEEKDSFIKEMICYSSQISNLFTERACKMSETSHPSLWWDNYGNTLPTFGKYAKRILSQPCKCSFDLKSNAFETAKMKKKNTVTRKSWDNHLFAPMNTAIMEKFTNSEVNLLRPINLENCNELPDYADPKQDQEGFQRWLTNETCGARTTYETDSSYLDNKLSLLLADSRSDTNSFGNCTESIGIMQDTGRFPAKKNKHLVNKPDMTMHHRSRVLYGRSSSQWTSKG